jgi:hypothetical protein
MSHSNPFQIAAEPGVGHQQHREGRREGEERETAVGEEQHRADEQQRDDTADLRDREGRRDDQEQRDDRTQHGNILSSVRARLRL